MIEVQRYKPEGRGSAPHEVTEYNSMYMSLPAAPWSRNLLLGGKMQAEGNLTANYKSIIQTMWESWHLTTQ
jgi:hypothetical protein